MRAFIVLLVLVVGIAGFVFGWFSYFTSPHDVNSVAGAFRSPSPSERPDPAVDDEGTGDQDEFRQMAEMRFKAMDLNLLQLKAKAKNGRAVTKEKLNDAIDELNRNTEDVRNELLEFRIAPAQQWKVRKIRLNNSMDELERGFEKAFARFMNESASLSPPTRTGIADETLEAP